MSLRALERLSHSSRRHLECGSELPALTQIALPSVDLRDELAREVPASLVEVAGPPDARSAACMLAVLETTLWS